MKSIIFNPGEELTSQEALNKFILMCKDELHVFGRDLPFDNHIWDITNHIELNRRTKTRLLFSNLEYSKKTNSKSKNDSIVPMKEPFLSFAKAYIRYKQGIKPVKNLTPLLTSLKIIEKAMSEMIIHPTPIELNSDILNRSSQIANEEYSHAVAYRIGKKLEEISKFISDKKISILHLDWNNSIRRPDDTQRVGKKADENRNNKMPSERALEILPEIFFNAKKPKDLLISSIVALLFSAPNRINEVFRLPYDCEIKQRDNNGKELYGLRWFPSKSAEPMIKWIIPLMVDTVKTSIQRIKKLTKTSREVAKWYEKNPKKLYLPKKLEYLREKEYLTGNQASLIFLGKIIYSATSFFKTHNIHYEVKKIKGIAGRKAMVKFKDLEDSILKLLPKSMPYINHWMKVKYSDLLFIQSINEYHSEKGMLIPTISHFETGFVSDQLGERGSTIFERFGYKEIDGSPLKIRTHQFRHYLNTLAQKGGASQIDIAKWSGRKNIQQNTVYDHVTADEMLEIVQSSIGDKNTIIGPLSDIEDIKKKVVITRDEYAQLKVRTAHRTELGVCIHDFSMLPCQRHMDCINCTEQICMKGEIVGNNNIRERKIEVERLLRIAVEEDDNGHISANRWVIHHSLELEKLTQLCDILDNPNVPEGSVIQISNISASNQIEQSQNRNIEDSGMDMNEMKDLLTEMGGII